MKRKSGTIRSEVTAYHPEKTIGQRKWATRAGAYHLLIGQAAGIGESLYSKVLNCKPH